MRRVLLASSLLLIPTLALADPQCSIQPAALAAATSPAASQAARLQPVSVETAVPIATSQTLRVIGADEIGRVAALQRIASAGAQLTDLGTECQSAFNIGFSRTLRAVWSTLGRGVRTSGDTRNLRAESHPCPSASCP